MITLELPYPPSVNGYYRSPTKGPLAGRTLISEKGRAYRRSISEMVASIPAEKTKAPAGRLAMFVRLYPPDRRRRDIDNPNKALLDALMHAGVIEDDSLIDLLTIERQDIVKGGMVRICITEYAKESA